MVNNAYGKKHTFNVPDDLKGSIAQKKKRFKYELDVHFVFLCLWDILNLVGVVLAKH